jgi:hypothetical protein
MMMLREKKVSHTDMVTTGRLYYLGVGDIIDLKIISQKLKSVRTRFEAVYVTAPSSDCA